MKKVFCIVVTYNGLPWIRKCLQSLRDSVYPLTVVVVDNASTDGTVVCIRDVFPEVQLVRSTFNKGFGGANNIGLQEAVRAGAGYVFLLNQDAWVEPDTVGHLVAMHESFPQYGILSPLHLNGKGDDLDLYFRRYFLKSEGGHVIGDVHPDQVVLSALVDTKFVNAAAWLIPMECVVKTGGFDPVFFHYGEDDHYAQRVRFHGFKIGICTRSKIYHDREDRIRNPSRDVNARAKKDHILFLNQACDLSLVNYRRLVFRRFLRYSISACLHPLNKEKRRYHYLMAKKIGASIWLVRKTRMATSRTNPAPYL